MNDKVKSDWDPRSEAVLRDSRAAYDEMRERCPVASSEFMQWSLFRHEDMTRVLHDHETFSNAVSQHLTVPNGMDPPEHTAYRRIVERLRERSTSTYVHIQSVLPIHPERYRLSILPDYPHITVPTRELVARLNEHLRQLATDFRDLEYIDLSTLCDDAGWLRGEYTDDGLHLNGPGIVAWARTLRETAHAQISQAAGQ